MEDRQPAKIIGGFWVPPDYVVTADCAYCIQNDDQSACQECQKKRSEQEKR